MIFLRPISPHEVQIVMGSFGSLVREMLTEQVEYRELLFQMTWRDLLLRYKQTAMGFAWAIFMPLVNTAIFSVIFTRVAPIETPVPYPLFAYSGLMAWNFFASSLRFSVTSLTGNLNLVTKVYFPREIFPFSAVIVALIDLAVAALVLVVLMVYYGVRPPMAIVMFPVVLLVHVLFTAGIALLLAMANLFYRDVKYLFEIGLTIWMFSTSVLYPVGAVPGLTGRLMRLNPMTPIVDSYRAVLVGTPLPSAVDLTVTATLSLLVFVGAWLIFHRAEFQFAENV
jgi:ABC-type polysaccharide/polyol phosphate export permease